MKKFIKEFRDFAMKGNVIDMAVGVVIGGSFGKIVTGLVNYIINPFIGIFTAKSYSLDSLKTVIHEATAEAEEVAIYWGTWLQTIIDFLITALCIFIVLKVLLAAKDKFEHKKIAAEKAKAEAEKVAAENEAAEAEKRAKEDRERTIAVAESLLRQEELLKKLVDNK